MPISKNLLDETADAGINDDDKTDALVSAVEKSVDKLAGAVPNCAQVRGKVY